MNPLLLLLPACLLLSGCINQHPLSYCTDVQARVKALLDEYEKDAQELAEERKLSEVGASVDIEFAETPATYWWDEEITYPLNSNLPIHSKTLDDLLLSSLQNSSQIRVFSEIPILRETGIQIANAIFDPVVFVNAQFDRNNRPVGSTLETTSSGDNRLKELEYSLEAGIRKRLITGANVELKEKLTNEYSTNSNTAPNPQGTAELTLRVTQPLLKGSGIAYNTTGIRISEIDSDVAQLEFLRQTESHLLEVVRSYWSLYQTRALYYQKQRLTERTQKILSELESRTSLDANSTQILRAKSALSQRKADLVRSEVAVRNSQDRLKSLLSDPLIPMFSEQEIVPLDRPFFAGIFELDILNSASQALKHRSELNQAFKQLEATMLRTELSKSDLLPTLSMFIEGTLSSLSGSNGARYANAWNNQFTQGRPGYAGGLNFEYPLCNNTAQAVYLRDKIEIRQQINQIITSIETILLEIKVATREISASTKDVMAKYDAMLAAEKDLEALTERRGVDVGTQMETAAYLEFLLESQARLTDAEGLFVNALVTHNIALYNLERAQGTLLSYRGIQAERSGSKCFNVCGELPSYKLVKKESE